MSDSPGHFSERTQEILARAGRTERDMLHKGKMMIDAYGRRVPNTEYHREQKKKDMEEIIAKCRAYYHLPWYKKLFIKAPHFYGWFLKYHAHPLESQK